MVACFHLLHQIKERALRAVVAHHDHLEVGVIRKGEERAQAGTEHLGLVLEQQHHRPANRANVDRLEGRIQDEHPAALTSTPLVLQERRGPHWGW